MLPEEIEILRRKICEWREDASIFVRDNFNVVPDRWQEKVLQALKDPKNVRIALRACAGPGKTAVLAWVGWWFLVTQSEEGDHPKGAAVAITRDNLRDNLWPEMAKWQARSEFLKLMFVWTKERIYAKDHPETWFLSARSFPQGAPEDVLGATLSGIHSGFTFFLLDETGNMPLAIARAAEQAMGSCKRGLIIQAGNPLTQSGLLYHCTEVVKNHWVVITISGDPDDPDRSPRVDLEWARSQINLYGRDHPWVMAYILGLFPDVAINSLLTEAEVEAAMSRSVPESEYSHIQMRMGIDVARFGLDSTVLFQRQGLQAFTPKKMVGARTDRIVEAVILMSNQTNNRMMFVDGTGGYGAGVVDSLLSANCRAVEVNFSSSATDTRYFNKRSEMWFLMAEWIKRGGCLPRDEKLKKQLTSAEYFFQKGKLRLEEKEQLIARIKMSPDEADALGLTFAIPDLKEDSMSEYKNYIMKHLLRIKKDYNPFLEHRF